MDDAMKSGERPQSPQNEDLGQIHRRVAELEARDAERSREISRLREEREMYRIVADFTSDWEYWTDTEGNFRYVSPSCERITGYPPEVFCKSPTFLEEIIHPDDRAAVAGYELAESHQDSSIPFRIITRDGRERWIAQRSQMVCDAEGKSLGKRFSNRDITGFKLTQEEKLRNMAVIERLSGGMSVIAEIGMLVSSTLELDQIYERIATATQRLVPADRFNIHMQTPDPECYVVAYSNGLDIPERRKGDLIPLRGSLTEIVQATRKGLLITVKSAEEMAAQFPHVIQLLAFRAGIRSMMVAPMIHQGVVIGNLFIGSKQLNAYNDIDLQLTERVGEQIAGAVANANLYTRLRETENSLRKTLDELERRVQERTFELNEVNTALRILLKKRDDSHLQIGEQLQSNVQQLVMPFLNKLKANQPDSQGLSYLKVLETNLTDIISPFVNHLSVAYKNLTPREIQIAALIRQGMKSGEIADLLGCSIRTVITHRNHIRHKLKLCSNHANLMSHLLSMR
jgi:PAS domain S-box-containing protein